MLHPFTRKTGNYRPICLLPIISKVLNVAEDSQNTVLLEIVRASLSLSTFFTFVGQCLDKNIQSDKIYLDFAKAFDSVHAM
jgi:hypothetical protein